MADYFLGTYGGGITKPFRQDLIKKICVRKLLLGTLRYRSTCSD